MIKSPNMNTTPEIYLILPIEVLDSNMLLPQDNYIILN
jgi:hypothetical protein